MSASTFISDSFYSNNGVTDPAAYDFPSRAATKPKPSQKREVDWGDRSSLRLSVDYTKQLSKASSPTNSDKGDANYFKICFATEFSDDDEDVQRQGIEPTEIDEDVKSALPETLPKLDQSFTARCSQPYAMICHAEVSVKDVNLLTAKTKKLLGPLPTINGFFFREALEKLLISQLQLILNDLLCQISGLLRSNLFPDMPRPSSLLKSGAREPKGRASHAPQAAPRELNDELMRELPLRDDLQIENEERKAHLQQFLLSRKLNYALDCKLVRPTTLLPPCQPISADYHSADSFNPKSPREKPQQLSSGPTPTSPRIAKLKSYFFGFFNKKRSKDTSPMERSSV
ncbi:unnamed protein product [Dibothriocephalus latus]|uniref:Schwannomin interacting protein 1 C-terminal domain-containing protein n=1 Tax=Dibothriocephalus latus TaxID=60516 RepID=A0A3P6TGR5_DIBLA|nr:unnamed protein product [Dibothriocephalus latus]